jgi:hypothetical protein
MDLSLPLIGILGVIGFNLNKQINSREYTDKRVKIPLSELSSGKSIYESREFSRTQTEEIKRVEKMRKNNEKIVLNSKSDGKPVPKKVTFKEKNINDYSQQESVTPDNKIFKGPMFNVDKYYIPSDNNKDFVGIEKFSDVSELTGKKIDLSHQNMTPFFGGKVKSGNNADTLGRYTGRDNSIHKVEVEATLNTQKDNVNGNVLFTDVISQDRFVGSTYNTAVLPFDQVRVKPIPIESTRTYDRNIDELRTLTKPKTVLEGRFNTGNAIGIRGILGEFKQPRVETTYELGEKRNFRTTGEEAGTYFQDTSFFRSSKKNITAETQLNQNSGVSYQRGNILRASKTDDGMNTVVQEDKRGNFLGDWVRSRKNVTSLNSAPTPENIMLRSQERETGNRADIGNVINKTKGAIKRIEDQLKTTNKELTLYEYKGTASSSNKKPENREAWYQNETKTKETREHTPSGSKIGAPGVGVEAYNFESKSRVGFENYMGSQAVYVQPSTHNIGETSHSKLDNDTIDYTSRLSDNRQMRSFDRPNGSITNNNF